jgi:hypothetical protein
MELKPSKQHFKDTPRQSLINLIESKATRLEEELDKLI